MTPPNKLLKWTMIGSVAFFALAIILAIAYILLPSSFGMDTTGASKKIAYSLSSTSDMVKSLIATGMMLFVVLAGVLGLAAFILAAIEISKSGNDGTWKIIWILITFILGIIGLLIYYFVARKDLKVLEIAK